MVADNYKGLQKAHDSEEQATKSPLSLTKRELLMLEAMTEGANFKNRMEILLLVLKNPFH
jgi:hypothetical protein